MVCNKIRKLIKAHKKGEIIMTNGPISEDVHLKGLPYDDEWAGSLLMLMERLDELRQFTIDEF